MSRERRKQGNYRITYEMLRSLIGLPENIRIDTVVNDQSRNIVDFYISSNEEHTNPRLYDHGEGQTMVQTTLEIETAIENMRERVRLWDEQQALNSAETESREAMNTLYGQITRSREESGT